MRLFLAVDLDEAACVAVALAADRLRRRAEERQRGLARAVKWVEPEHLHLTLHFLGEIDEARMDALMAALAPAIPVPPGRVGLGGWGVFPATGPAKVIWIGVTSGTRVLGHVHAELGARLRRAGLAPEGRPFSPHLTVGRVRRPTGTDWGALFRGAPPAPCEFEVESCALYQSRLSAAGPSYEALLRIPLLGRSGGGSGADGTMP